MGPAGTGKTYRCLKEIREHLLAAPDGRPLVLLAPKQMTYQLERELLADPDIAGYTRLQISSFERFAHFVFQQIGGRAPDLLDQQGRLMVLRALIARKRDDLKLFRASARLNGFARQLSMVLGELQQKQLTPESLNELAEKASTVPGLASKLQDLATLLHEYLEWLKSHSLQDADSLVKSAAEALSHFPKPAREEYSPSPPPSRAEASRRPVEERVGDRRPFGNLFQHVWVDGFT